MKFFYHILCYTIVCTVPTFTTGATITITNRFDGTITVAGYATEKMDKTPLFTQELRAQERKTFAQPGSPITTLVITPHTGILGTYLKPFRSKEIYHVHVRDFHTKNFLYEETDDPYDHLSGRLAEIDMPA
jgi:hypothetical protein